jgi:hypothetical protein
MQANVFEDATEDNANMLKHTSYTTFCNTMNISHAKCRVSGNAPPARICKMWILIGTSQVDLICGYTPHNYIENNQHMHGFANYAQLPHEMTIFITSKTIANLTWHVLPCVGQYS